MNDYKTQNFKVNLKQALKDVSVLERTEMHLERLNDQQLLEIAF